MTRLRRLAAASLVLALVIGTAGCSAISDLIEGVAPQSGTELIGTTWSGVDSDGDAWGFGFQEDGTVALTYNGDEYDDATDTWRVGDGVLEITVVFVTGPATLSGPFVNVSTPIDLDGRQGNITWTLTIERD